VWNDIQKREAAVLHRSLEQRDELFFVGRETLRDKCRSQLDGQASQIDRFKGIDGAGFILRPKVRGCRILSLGQSITTIIHNQVNHVQVSANNMYKLSHSD